LITASTLVVILAPAALAPSASAARRIKHHALTAATIGPADIATGLAASGIATVGGYMGYTMTLSNNGPDAASPVTVSDSTPSGWASGPTTFYCVGSVPAPGSGGGWCGPLPSGVTCTTPNVGSPGTVTCTINTIYSGASVSIIMAVHVGFYLHNQAICDSATATYSLDPNTANNTASVCSRVN
jgi:uncharacterized repeat protein (TIGR01451 family)